MMITLEHLKKILVLKIMTINKKNNLDQEFIHPWIELYKIHSKKNIIKIK